MHRLVLKSEERLGRSHRKCNVAIEIAGKEHNKLTKEFINQILGYLGTWSGFEAATTAPWPTRGFHRCGKFLEPSDE